MEIRQLNTFVTIALLGSFIKAADSLGYAQSSITAQIQALENELDTKLFERIGRNIALTSDGKNFLVYAKKILKLSEEAKAVVGDSATPKGVLTVGAPESLYPIRLAGLFKEYHTRYPDVELVIKFGSCMDFQRFLRESTIDVAIFLDRQMNESDFVTELRFVEPMAILTSPGNPICKKDKVYPEDLKDQSLILTESGCSYRAVLDNILANSGVRPKSILESGSVQAIKQLVTDGLGITLLPRVAVEEEINQGYLISLNWEGPEINMMTQVIYHKDKWLSASMRGFLELIKNIEPVK